MPAPIIGAIAHQRIIANTDYRQTVSIANSPTRVEVDGMQDGWGYSYQSGTLTLYGRGERLVSDEQWIIVASNPDGSVQRIVTYDVVEAAPMFRTIPRTKIGRGVENRIEFPFTNAASQQEIRGPLIGLMSNSGSGAIVLTGEVPDVDYSITSGEMDAKIGNTGGEDAMSFPFDIVRSPTAVRSLRSSSTRSGVVTLSWQAPLTFGGSASAGYQVREDDNDPVNVSGTSYRLPGIYEEGTYQFFVRPINRDGIAGPWSQVSETVIRVAPPDAPFLSGFLSGSQARLSWNTPNNNGGTITSYQISINFGGWFSVGNVNSYNRNVIVGTTSFRVRAVNSEGAGAASNSVSITLTVTPPSISVSISIRIGSNFQEVYITSISTVGGDPATSYEYNNVSVGLGWRSANVGTVVGSKHINAPTFTFTIQFRGSNAGGTGPTISRSATLVYVAPATRPATPFASLSISGTFLSASWGSNGDGGSPILGYSVSITGPGGTYYSQYALSRSTSFTVSQAGTYSLSVSATNAIGTSSSTSRSAVYRPPTPAPGRISTIIAQDFAGRGTGRILIVAWTSATNANSYSVSVADSQRIRSTTTTLQNWQVDRQYRTGTRVSISVYAIGPGGTGPTTTISYTIGG